MDVSRDIIIAPAVALAKSTSWQLFFIISIFTAVPGLLLLPLFAPWNPKPLAINRLGLEEEDIWGPK